MLHKKRSVKAGADGYTNSIINAHKRPNMATAPEYFRKYNGFGLDSLLRRKAWLENILFTKRIKEYSNRKASQLFFDYQQLKKELKYRESKLQ